MPWVLQHHEITQFLKLFSIIITLSQYYFIEIKHIYWSIDIKIFEIFEMFANICSFCLYKHNFLAKQFRYELVLKFLFCERMLIYFCELANWITKARDLKAHFLNFIFVSRVLLLQPQYGNFVMGRMFKYCYLL